MLTKKPETEHLAEKEMALELYIACMTVCMNQRTGLDEIPARAIIHRELIESSTINDVTSLEHAEQVLAKYRRQHPEMWNRNRITACNNIDRAHKPLSHAVAHIA